MARTNVYIRAGDSNRDVSIGGRRANSSGWARLNTDNATGSDCCLVASVEVLGQRGKSKPRMTCDCGHKYESRYEPDKCPECNRPREGMDTRKSVFEVELPEQQDGNCEVSIVPHGHHLAQLARFGAALCFIKGTVEEHQGKQKKDKDLVKQGKMTVKKAMEILQELEDEVGKNLPHVTLPSGVTLAHALACVEVCRRLATGDPPKN